MKIKYVPPSPKAGTSEHLPPHRAQAQIDAGFAVAEPRARYGTAAWHAEQRELEALRIAAIPEGQRENNSATPVWTLRKTPTEKYVVGYHCMTEDRVYGPTVLEGGAVDNKHFVKVLKHAGCPQNIIDQYLKAVSQPDYLYMERQRIEADKRRAAEQAEREKHAVRFI